MLLKIFFSKHRRRETQSDDVVWFFRKRYYLIFLLFCGMIVNILLRTNLSIAIVEMTSSKNVTVGNITYTQEPEFKWNSMEKGVILSSFSWGYFLSPIGGLLSNKYGGVSVFGIGVLITSLLTLLSTLLVRLNIIIFMIGRTLEGVAEGSAIAGSVEIFVHWTPENERSRGIGIAMAGFHLGAAVAYPICGFAAGLYGWEAMFFITGGIALLWFLIWFIFVSRDPATDKFISEKEKLYLSKHVSDPLITQITYPWKSIFTSKAVWALFNERFLTAMFLSFTIYCISLYVKDVNNVSIENIGLISSIPNFSSFLGTGMAAFSLDYVRNKKILTISNVHKSVFIGTKIICTVILTVMVLSTEFEISIVCLSLFRLCYAFSDPANWVLPLDLSPHHASMLVGLCSIASCLGYVINPIILGLIVQHHTVFQWNMYFGVLCGLNVWGCLIFFFFGSGELQPWAMQSESKNSDLKKPTEGIEEHTTGEVTLSKCF